MLTSALSLLFISVDPATKRLLADALEQAHEHFEVWVEPDVASALKRLFRQSFDLILYDLDLPESSRPDALEQLFSFAPSFPVIVLGAVDDPHIGIDLIRMGAHDYLVKSRLTPAALVRCIRHAMERHKRLVDVLVSSRAGKAPGKVISFLGVKGGVGLTTTLVNVASALAQKGRKVLAMEMFPSWGLATVLRRPRTRGIGELLEDQGADFDGRLLQSRLTLVPHGFEVLFGSRSSREMAPQKVDSLVKAAASLADIVLVDTPHLPHLLSPAHKAVLAASDFVALVMEPESLCAEFAEKTLEVLEEWELNPAYQGLILVNRAGLATSLTPRELKTRLRCEIVGVVPAAGEGCVAAFNAGKPLYLLQPESRYSTSIDVLAENLLASPVRTIQL